MAPRPDPATELPARSRSEEHTSELQSLAYLVCRLLLEKKKTPQSPTFNIKPILSPPPHPSAIPLPSQPPLHISPRPPVQSLALYIATLLSGFPHVTPRR